MPISATCDICGYEIDESEQQEIGPIELGCDVHCQRCELKIRKKRIEENAKAAEAVAAYEQTLKAEATK